MRLELNHFMKKSLLLCLIFICATTYSQKKSLKTVPISGNLIIDGNLDEPNWKTAFAAKDFYMFAPDNGKLITTIILQFSSNSNSVFFLLNAMISSFDFLP